MKNKIIAALSLVAIVGIVMGIRANSGGAFAGGLITGAVVTSAARSGNNSGGSCTCDCSKEVRRATKEHEKRIKQLEKENDKLRNQ